MYAHIFSQYRYTDVEYSTYLYLANINFQQTTYCQPICQSHVTNITIFFTTIIMYNAETMSSLSDRWLPEHPCYSNVNVIIIFKVIGITCNFYSLFQMELLIIINQENWYLVC